MIEHFSRRSKICRRFLSCLKKLEDGTLEKKDLCPGGANCKGGICGDKPDFDWESSCLLDNGDWMYGRPSGYGIQLTKYGLVPLNVQRQRAAEAAAQEEALREQERVKEMISSSESFPTLGSSSKTAVCAKTHASSSPWGKSKDWSSITAKANEIEAEKIAERKKELAKEREHAAAIAAKRAESYDYESDSYDYDDEYCSDQDDWDEEAYDRFKRDAYDDEW
jgi:hypothetical protein